jgi:hypothetical protein
LTTAKSSISSRKSRCYSGALALGAYVAAVAFVASPARGAPQSTPLPAARQLQQRISATWNGQQLGAALARLAAQQRLAIWIDRRVDPNAVIELEAVDRSVGDVLTDLAAPLGCTAVEFAGVAYFGPSQTAGELATLAAKAREPLAKASPEVRRGWLQLRSRSFARLSEPRAVLVELAGSIGARLDNAQIVPHDLWPARTLPAMAPLDCMVLALAGFDLTCQVSEDGRRVHVKPIERPVLVTRRYLVPAARRADVEAALAAMPQTQAKLMDGQLQLAARVEEHEAVAAAIRGRAAEVARSAPPARRPTMHSQQRFTLKIEGKPVGAVVDQLARQLQLEVVWDESLSTAPNAGRNATTSCDVRSANLEELLKAVLAPAGLAFERDGQRVEIRPAK